MNEEYLFPTPVWWCDLPDINLNELRQTIYEVRDDHDTQVRSNVGGYQSQDFNGDFLLTCDDALGDLARALQERAVGCYSRFQSAATQIKLANLWININEGPHYNQTHTHPGSVLSGAFYVTAPEGSGRIIFHRDHASAFNYASLGTMEDFATGQDDAGFMYNQFSYPPIEGRLIIFPSWIPHGVETGTNTSERISISFNFVPVKLEGVIEYGSLKHRNRIRYAM